MDPDDDHRLLASSATTATTATTAGSALSAVRTLPKSLNLTNNPNLLAADINKTADPITAHASSDSKINGASKEDNNAVNGGDGTCKAEDEDRADDVDGVDVAAGESDSEDDSADNAVDPLEPVRGEVRCVPSIFPHRPPTIYFDYPLALRDLSIIRSPRIQGPGADYYVEDLAGRKIFYKSQWERNCIKNAFIRAGFRRKLSGVQWNAAWTKHPTTEGFERLNRFQKVNHFPGSWCIGRKDRLMRCIGRAKRAVGGQPGVPSDAFDIIPAGWILPTEYNSWRRQAEDKNQVFIIKPSASACGRGIRLIHKNNINTVPKDKPCVMQQYLHKPYLINGKKFDLRVYVLCTSFDPLRCYVFQEGLARFSTHQYTMKKLNSRFAHLTNYSVNKKSKHFVPPTSDNNSDMEGSKWSLSALWRFLSHAEGTDKVREVQTATKHLIVKTLIAAEGEIAPQIHRHLKNPGSCYELFGFDVFLDEKLKPWLIEVNVSPSLMGSSPLDQKIKGTLMADVFHLTGMVPFDESALKTEKANEKAMRMAGTYKSIKKNSSGRMLQDLWRKNPHRPETVNLGNLSDEDWEMIYDLEDEYSRRGHFTRLFPNTETCSHFLRYFQSPRFNNALLCAWLIYGRSSYVKTSHLLENGSSKQKESVKKKAEALMSKIERAGKSTVPQSQQQKSYFNVLDRISGGASELVVEGAPAIVLVPGVNCAPARCPLVELESEEAGNIKWLMPLGKQSADRMKEELAVLLASATGGEDGIGVNVGVGAARSESSCSNDSAVENNINSSNGSENKFKKKRASAADTTAQLFNDRTKSKSFTRPTSATAPTAASGRREKINVEQYKIRVADLTESGFLDSKRNDGFEDIINMATRVSVSANARGKERQGEGGLRGAEEAASSYNYKAVASSIARQKKAQQQQQLQQSTQKSIEELFADSKLIIQNQLQQAGIGRGNGGSNTTVTGSRLSTSIYAAQKFVNKTKGGGGQGRHNFQVKNGRNNGSPTERNTSAYIFDD